jgi:hypothetical protein
MRVSRFVPQCTSSKKHQSRSKSAQIGIKKSLGQYLKLFFFEPTCINQLTEAIVLVLAFAGGLDIKNQQKHGRNQHEQQTGHKPQIINFHQNLPAKCENFS